MKPVAISQCRTSQQVRGTQGFTLLEMTIVLAIMSIVAISLVAMFSATLQRIQTRQTVSRMEAIQNALYEYRIAFNRLPCPADATLAITNSNFGYEAANPGECTGGAPAANFSQVPVAGAQDAREGMVPVKSLGLSDDYAIDGWGRRFLYAVSKDITANGAFSIISMYDTSDRMSVLNAEGTVKSTLACEVLVSMGANGHGAYGRNGGATRINAGSTNLSELDNCDCAAGSPGFNGVFVQKDVTTNPNDVTDSFDDFVYFSSRGDYILPSSVMAQPFTLDAGGALSGNSCAGGKPVCAVSGGITRCSCSY